MTTRSCPAGLYSTDFFRDPFAYYARLRECDPVSWDEDQQTWVVTRYADVGEIIRRPDVFSAQLSVRDARPVSPPVRPQDADASRAVAAFRVAEFIQNDPPAHGRTRRAVSARFAPRSMEALRPMVRRIIDTLLDAVDTTAVWDVVQAIARPLPMQVISELMGVPDADRATIADQAHRRMASVLSLADDRMQRSAAGFAETASYVTGAVGRRVQEARSCPMPDDVLGDIAAAQAAGRWTPLESQANAMMIIDAGHETTVQLIGNSTLALLRHPAQWQRLVGDPGRYAADATEECLRYEPPLHALRRIVTGDVEVLGVTMRAGDRVLGVLASANRDPERFAAPETFDIGRTPNPHLAFGAGAHYCLGQYLARMEGQEYLTALATRFPTLRLAGDDITHVETPRVRSVTRLPVLVA